MAARIDCCWSAILPFVHSNAGPAVLWLIILCWVVGLMSVPYVETRRSPPPWVGHPSHPFTGNSLYISHRRACVCPTDWSFCFWFLFNHVSPSASLPALIRELAGLRTPLKVYVRASGV
ncbi:hypothetical protein B0H63DRAFT_118424 [Podospora didyma]|uniref:Uncharacterized protein n=1 Tax=Podospora didyma TaxID=330526 RepID=A0AAE0NZL2_9PEZI|nr:hypothetical protein B0H63DRAFT_118424 [Podospora didyma]